MNKPGFIGTSQFSDGGSVFFYNREGKVLAKVYSEDEKIGKCLLEGLPTIWWSYITLPAFAKIKIDHIRFQKIFVEAIDPYDSDEEDLEALNDLIIYKKQLNIPAISMTILCVDQPLKGSTLIEIAHDRSQFKYYGVKSLVSNGKLAAPIEWKEGIPFITDSKDWFLCLGGWKGMMPLAEIQNYAFYDSDPNMQGKKFTGVKIFQSDLVYTIVQGRIHLPKGFSIRGNDLTKAWELRDNKWAGVPSGKTDLSYSQIVKGIDVIKRIFKLTDNEIARFQLSVLSQNSAFPDWFNEIDSEKDQKDLLYFINYLNGLMFGIEASGLNAALVLGLMTLDLIADRRIDYEKAFYANRDGGVYPYASFGDNKGAYSVREKLIYENRKGGELYHYSCSMKSVRKNTKPSHVAAKEALLIKYWLQCNNFCEEKMTYFEQVEQTIGAIDMLIDAYFFPE